MVKTYVLLLVSTILSGSQPFSEVNRELIPIVQAKAICPGAPQQRFGVNIRTEIPAYRIDHSLNRAEIGWMGTHKLRGDILGVHTHGVNVNYAASFAAEPYKNGYCFWVREIDVVLRYAAPEIYIAREYSKGSCNYNVVLEHEMRHRDVARKIMRQYEPRFRSLFTSLLIPKPKSAVLVSSREQAKQKTRAVIERLIIPVYNEFQLELGTAQAKVDSPSEYRKVRRRCARW